MMVCAQEAAFPAASVPAFGPAAVHRQQPQVQVQSIPHTLEGKPSEHEGAGPEDRGHDWESADWATRNAARSPVAK